MCNSNVYIYIFGVPSLMDVLGTQPDRLIINVRTRNLMGHGTANLKYVRHIGFWITGRWCWSSTICAICAIRTSIAEKITTTLFLTVVVSVSGLYLPYWIVWLSARVRDKLTCWGTTAATRVPRWRIGERPREVAQEGSTG